MATFKGVISHTLPEQSGVSKSGNQWRKRTFVLTYDQSNANYPKAVVFDVMNGKIDELNLQPGVEYEVEIDFAAREYQGKFYQSASAWRATAIPPVVQQAPVQQGQQVAYPQPSVPQAPATSTDDDSLPF